MDSVDSLELNNRIKIDKAQTDISVAMDLLNTIAGLGDSAEDFHTLNPSSFISSIRLIHDLLNDSLPIISNKLSELDGLRAA